MTNKIINGIDDGDGTLLSMNVLSMKPTIIFSPQFILLKEKKMNFKYSELVICDLVFM